MRDGEEGGGGRGEGGAAIDCQYFCWLLLCCQNGFSFLWFMRSFSRKREFLLRKLHSLAFGLIQSMSIIPWFNKRGNSSQVFASFHFKPTGLLINISLQVKKPKHAISQAKWCQPELCNKISLKFCFLNTFTASCPTPKRPELKENVRLVYLDELAAE